MYLRFLRSHRQQWCLWEHFSFIIRAKTLPRGIEVVFVDAVKERTHCFIQKSPLPHFILCFISVWSTEGMRSGTGYAENNVPLERNRGAGAMEDSHLKWNFQGGFALIEIPCTNWICLMHLNAVWSDTTLKKLQQCCFVLNIDPSIFKVAVQFVR